MTSAPKNHSTSRYQTIVVVLATISLCLFCRTFKPEKAQVAEQVVRAVEEKVVYKEVVKVNEVPVVVDNDLSEKQQIIAYINQVFGDDAADAIVIIRKCENSSFNPKATNHNRNGTWDAGIFQVNEIHGYSLEEMHNWKKNIDAAYKIFKNSGKKWTPWSCAEHVGQTPFHKL